MKKVLFIDRDGTLIREPLEDFQVDRLDKFSFVPEIISYLSKIAKELDYTLVVVTNQDGLGTDSFPERDFWPLQELMMRTLESERIQFKDVFIDRSFEADLSPYRKPGTAMLTKYLKGDYDLKNSFVIGDRWSDIPLAHNLNAGGIFFKEIDTEDNECPEHLIPTLHLRTSSWKDIYIYLKSLNRNAHVIRSTSETHIDIALDLDDNSLVSIHTGLAFLDHMLDQIARHGHIGMVIHSKGDLHIDEHHTIEDTAITLGKAFYRALGKKVGIERYGFSLPMDDCEAQVLIDFGGRAWIEWDVSFQREFVGDVPTEMFYHFFKSFSEHAQCNLHIKAYGENEHHKIEAVFKAFAKAIKQAVTYNRQSDQLPSTKGSL